MGKTGGFSKAFGLRRAAVLAAALAGLLLALEVSAQGVKPSTTAPKANQPTAGSTTTSSTGKSVPSINIVAPNSAGVSHNIYNQFNVGPNGLILNNATQAGQSQIGGQLGANPNFTGGHYASLILNEVTGGSASSLQGYIEIFGHSADFILANPAGVTCNGCGFINTPRVTLTTGTPNLDANGGLSGFTVGGSGQISIEGTVDITGVRYFDVAARSIFVGGEIGDSAMQAEVGLFAGRNNFDYNARTATALADDGSAKPAFGIDASAGSIKAGKIAAQSTEKGVGARTGNLQAGAGGMMLTADGKLVLAKTQSQGAISAKSVSGDIQIAGQLWSQASLDLWAGGNIGLLAQVSAGALGNVSVTAQGLTLNEGAVLGAGLDAATGNFTGGGALTLAAASLWNAGTMHATQNVTLGLTGVLNNQATGTIQADGTLTVNAASLENYGSADPSGPRGEISGQMLAVNAGDIANAGKLLASQALTIASSGQVMNALGTIQAGGRLSITAAGNVENLSGVIQGQDVAINAQTIDNVTLVSSNGQLTLPTEFAGASSQSLQALFGTQNGAFLNGLGVPLGGAAAATPQTVSWFGLDLAAVGQGSSSGTAAQQAQIGATNGVTLNASKDINSVGGKLGAGTDLNLNAGGSVSIQAAELTGTPSSTTHLGSALTAGGNVTVNAGGDVTIQGSTVTAGKNAQINAQGQVTLLGVQDEVKTDTRQKSCGWFGLDCSTSGGVSDTVTALAATVNAGGWVQIKGKDIAANGGNIGAQGSVTLTASGSVVNMLGSIAAGGGVTINAGGNFENLSGTVQGQDVTVNAQTIENLTLVRRDGQLLLPAEYAALLNVNASPSASAALPGVLALLSSQNSTLLSAFGISGIAVSGASSAHTDVAAQQASIGATNGVTLNARQDIDNVGGKLAATNGDLTLNASGNVNVQAQELSTVKDANNSTTTHVKSALSAGGNVTINAGGDATITATDVTSGKNTQITAGGGVTLGAAQDETKSYSSHKSCILWGLSCSSSSTASDNVTEVVTTVNAGGWVQAEAKTKDLLGTATNVNAQGDINLLADKGNASVVAGQNISWSHSTSGNSYLWGAFGSSHSSTDGATTVAPSLISAKGNEHVTVQGDFLLKGSALTAGGSIFVTAQNIDLIAAQNTTYHSQMDEKWGIFAAAGAGNGTASVTLAWQDSKTTTSDVQTSSQGASLEAGGNLTINAGGNLNVTGSTATAAGDVNIHAAQVNLMAAQDTDVKQTNTTIDSFGILPAMNNGFGFAIGANLVNDKNGATTVSNIGALIGSTGGSVFINASGAVNAQGSIVESLAGNVTVTAPTIAMAAGIDSFSSYAYHSATFVGINVSVEAGANNPLSAVQKGATYLNAADKTKDPQAKLLYEAAAGVQAAQGALNVYKAMDAPGGLTGAMTSFSIKIGVGVSVSTQESGATVQQASGGYILAAGNLGLYATVGDLTLKGANVSAYNVTLSAQRDLVMQSLALTDTSYSKSSSYSAFAGLAANASYGAEGMSVSYGINVSASDATSQSQTMAVNHAQTTVSGTGFVTLASGRDTNLYGAEVSGGGIAAQVARNLNIVSDQDTETQSAAQTSWSFSATVGYGTASLSASYAKGDAYGNYASVTTTSGLFAGSSGYAVTVGGTTTLTAAALASSADASKNSLVTGALVTQNLTNSMNWKASYWGFSFSASNTGVSGIQPGLSQKQSGSSSGIAQATIAPGTVTILNAALQKSLTGKTPDQIVAALNRSATAQNKAAGTLPGGLLQTLQNQADRSNALMAASSSTAKLVGDVSSMLKTSADQTVATLGPKEQNGTITPEEQQQLDAARLQASLWGEDGAARILVHGATQGVLAWLGGGFSLDAGLRGAGGAMLSATLAPILKSQAEQLLKDAGIDDPKASGPLASLIAELAVTGFASSLGNMAAVTAASVDLNNRQLHPLEIKFLSDPAVIQKFIDEEALKGVQLSQDDAAQLLARVGASIVDSHWYNDFNSSNTPYYFDAQDFILAQSANLKLDNGQVFFDTPGKQYWTFGMWGSAALRTGDGYAFYNKYLNVGGSSLMFLPNEALGVLKGSGTVFADFTQGVTTLLTEPGQVWNGMKAIASDPGSAAQAAGTAFVTSADLYTLYRMAGADDEAEAVRSAFIMNTVLAVDGVARLPGLAKDLASLTGTAADYVAGLARSGDAVPAAAKTLEGAPALTAVADDAAQWRPCNLCFAAGTLVKTEAGYEPIESLKVGSLVPSEDPKTGAISLRRITHVHVRPIETIKTFYKLTISKNAAEEDFYVTGEHPFWLPDKAEWRTVDNLSVGDALLDFGGHRLHVSAKLALSDKRQTYNITVEGTSTYFVGRSEVLVHNCLPTGYSRDAATGIITETATNAVWKLAGTTEDGKAILENLSPSRNPANPFITAGETGEAVPLAGGSGSNSALWNTKTGTVWDSVTPTQGTLPVTELPRSFILETEGENVWVAPNAVRHLQEDAAALINNQAVNPMFVQIQVQANLTSLQEAVGVATQNGITYDTLMNVGGWELKFSPGRAADQLPALFHAQPLGVGK